MKRLIEALNVWWSGISQREQRLLIICALLLVVGALYWGLLQPMQQRAEQAQMRISSERQLLGWVKEKADRISELRGRSGQSARVLPLNQVVSTSVGRYKVDLIRMQPRDQELQVWVQPLSFNQLLSWLAHMRETHGVEVQFIDLAAAEQPGVVEVKRLQLKRGQ